jgi:hypothetical protein
MDNTSKKLNRQTEKMLSRWNRQEQHLKKLVNKADPQKVDELFGTSSLTLNQLENRMKTRSGLLDENGDVPSYLDSLSATLKFIKDQDLLKQQQHVLAAINSESQLRIDFNNALAIQNFIQEKKQLYTSAFSGIKTYSRSLKKLQQEAYYYNARVSEYKEALHDPKKAELKAMEILNKSGYYQKFMQKNTVLASIFNFPADINSNRILDGLQLRDAVNSAMITSMGSSSSAQQVVASQLREVENQFREYRSRFPNLDNAAQMPDFKPNPMKTLSIWQRLEPGANLQMSPSNRYFPAQAELAAQIAYKFSQKGSIGIGIAYKLGLGTGWDHIAFSHRGAGIRAFIAYKIKNSFYVNGGYEGNRNIPFTYLSELKVTSLWQKSALIGISKKFRVNDKLKSSVMLLYDFLAPEQFSITQRFKVRYGYSF